MTNSNVNTIIQGANNYVIPMVQEFNKEVVNSKYVEATIEEIIDLVLSVDMTKTASWLQVEKEQANTILSNVYNATSENIATMNAYMYIEKIIIRMAKKAIRDNFGYNEDKFTEIDVYHALIADALEGKANLLINEETGETVPLFKMAKSYISNIVRKEKNSRNRANPIMKTKVIKHKEKVTYYKYHKGINQIGKKVLCEEEVIRKEYIQTNFNSKFVGSKVQDIANGDLYEMQIGTMGNSLGKTYSEAETVADLVLAGLNDKEMQVATLLMEGRTKVQVHEIIGQRPDRIIGQIKKKMLANK